MASDTPKPGSESALHTLFYDADRVRFVHWDEFSGAKTTVVLTVTIAVLSFITGLSHLSQQVVPLDGPLAAFLPAASSVVRIAGILFAFVLGGLAVGLQRRIRLAWYGATVALPMVALLPLATAQATDVPMLLLTVVTFPMVIRNRHQFDKPLDLSPFQIAALAAFFGVQIYGTLGTYVMREQYDGIDTVIDAFYYIVVTGTTVGYGDLTPDSQTARLFTLTVIITGTAAFTAAFGSLIVPALESRMAAAFGNMTASELTLLEDHVLVLGYGELTEPLLDELEANADVVVITEDTDRASELKDRDVSVLTADPTDEAALLDARIDTARGVVVATRDDAHDALAILAARQANPDVRVVAAAHDQKHLDKLAGVGADEVISPTVIGGQMLGQSVLETPDLGLDGGESADDED